LDSVIPCTAVVIGVTDDLLGQIFKCGVEIIACFCFAIFFEVIGAKIILFGPACWHFAKVRLIVHTAAVDDIHRIAIASTIARTAVVTCVKVIITSRRN